MTRDDMKALRNPSLAGAATRATRSRRKKRKPLALLV